MKGLLKINFVVLTGAIDARRKFVTLELRLWMSTRNVKPVRTPQCASTIVSVRKCDFIIFVIESSSRAGKHNFSVCNKKCKQLIVV
jgi:hypothetical protein